MQQLYYIGSGGWQPWTGSYPWLETAVHGRHSPGNMQGRNEEVYRIRDQREKKGVASGITGPGFGITSLGIGNSGAARGSGIKFSDRKTNIIKCRQNSV